MFNDTWLSMPLTMVVLLSGSKPSSPRWFFCPGPVGRVFSAFLLASSVLFTSGCGSVAVTDYRDRQPAFAPNEFFAAALTAHGVVKNFNGEVTRTFNADIVGCWNQGIGTLDEQFLFDDGEQQTRFWTLEPTGTPDRYRATAGDVVGIGDAQWSGNALFLDYVLRIALEDGSIDVAIDDRMYRVSDNVVINESVMRKFGVKVGTILLTIVRHPSQPYSCPS